MNCDAHTCLQNLAVVDVPGATVIRYSPSFMNVARQMVECHVSCFAEMEKTKDQSWDISTFN